jgi:cytidyltransferase-like protein
MKPKQKKPIVVVVSGGFDPLHAGHVRMIREAKKLGDKLVVVLKERERFYASGRTKRNH